MKYEKRIYVDAATEETLTELAQVLGFITQMGPATGQGSKQEFLGALTTAYREDPERVPALLREIITPET